MKSPKTLLRVPLAMLVGLCAVGLNSAAMAQDPSEVFILGELQCPAVPGLVAKARKDHIAFESVDEHYTKAVWSHFVDGLLNDFRLVLTSTDLAWLRSQRDSPPADAVLGAAGRGDCSPFVGLVARVRESYQSALHSRPGREVLIEEVLRSMRQASNDGAVVPPSSETPDAFDPHASMIRVARHWESRFGLERSVAFAVDGYVASLAELEEEVELDVEDRVLAAMARAMDPHTRYVPPAEAAVDLARWHESTYVGLGVVLGRKPTPLGIEVVALVPGGPAGRLGGLRLGDFISEVDGWSTIGSSYDRVASRVRGRVFSMVSLTIQRPGVDKPLHVSLRREPIAQSDASMGVTRRKVGDKTVLHVAIGSFLPGIAARLEELLRLEVRLGVDAVILDLRGNTGGLMREARDLVSLFVGNEPLYQLRERDGKSEVWDHDASVVFDGPLVVAVNGESASASEIVAGAFQDLGRGLVVGGRRTFGKGTFQSPKTLPTGGVLYLTVGRYYLPSGRSVQGDGLSSDLRVPGPDDEPDLRDYPANDSAALAPGGTEPMVFAKQRYSLGDEHLAALSERVRQRTEGRSLGFTEQLDEITQVATDYSRLFRGQPLLALSLVGPK